MSRIHFGFFFLIIFTLYFLIHFFVYTRLIKGLYVNGILKNSIAVIFWVGGLSFFLDKFLGKLHILFPFSFFGSLWAGMILIAFTIFILQSLILLIFPHYAQKITMLAIVLTLVLSALSIYNVVLPPRIREVRIPCEGLPANLSPFSIVQLSDLHIEPFKSEEWLEGIVQMTNALSPDLIVFTGDLIDREIDSSMKFCELLKGLRAQYGMLAIPGNHEFYAGIDKFSEFCKNSGIDVLRNTRKRIAGGIEVAGIDDETSERALGIRPDLEAVIGQCDTTMPIILLAHRPTHFVKAAGLGVDVQLSGHTHAGQIPPIDIIVHLIYKYPYGLYRYNSSHIYTTCGTGTWGPPMRLFSRSEIVKIVLSPH